MRHLDKAYMEQAVWAPYGNEQYTTFVSDRMDFEKAYRHMLFSQDYSALSSSRAIRNPVGEAPG